MPHGLYTFLGFWKGIRLSPWVHAVLKVRPAALTILSSWIPLNHIRTTLVSNEKRFTSRSSSNRAPQRESLKESPGADWAPGGSAEASERKASASSRSAAAAVEAGAAPVKDSHVQLASLSLCLCVCVCFEILSLYFEAVYLCNPFPLI